jgi:hypothetical protein
MHVDAKKFLITVCDPLNLTIQTKIENEGRMMLGMALQGQLALLRSRGFIPSIVYTDPHSTFRSMTQDFPGVEIDVGGTGDYVAKVDAKIRRLKETYRSVKSGLAWELPSSLVEDLLAYVVSRMNIRRTTALRENVCPRVLFTGIPVDYKKELLLAFGDYVEAYEGTDNTSAARSAACIALYPANNASGSWVLWKLETRSRVRRSNLTKLVTSNLIIQAMNAVAKEEAQAEMVAAGSILPEVIARQQSTEEGEQLQPTAQPAEAEAVEESQEVEPEASESPEGTAEEERDTGVTTRLGRRILKPSRYVAVTKVSQKEWKQEATDKAIKEELTMLIEELTALRAVKRAAIKGGAKILRSHMFVVAKYLANGEFERMKARLVADGRDQDPEMYPNKASPTVAIHSVFAVLGLASTKHWRIVVKIDIKGAFIQTPMMGEKIYMRLDAKMTKYAVELYPELAKMVETDGCLYMEMLKAMYGCVQASALWYALIKKFLEDLGYVASEVDTCVFWKVVKGQIFILLLYVDNILAIIDDDEAKILRTHLEKRFGTVKFEVGNQLSYLGMELEIGDPGTTVGMSFYTQQLLEGVEVPVKLSPGTKTTFQVDEEAVMLTEEERKLFHSKTAKLLHLAKRARPDILTIVSFLCTRVTVATIEDQAKLDRVLGYLRGTVDRKLILRTQRTGAVYAYVDAAYALHNDSKSHSGVVIYVGETLVYVSSKKQKCMSKSPSEAELIALTDNLRLVELFQEFMQFLTGMELPVPVIYQDCTAVVTLVTKGGGMARTKHFRARIHLGRESVQDKRVIVEYLKAEEMIADGFSKPYDPAEHKKFAMQIQGEGEYE